MRRQVEFVKLSGSGNDFICIDNRDGGFDDLLALPELSSRFAAALCHRGLGVGADGVIFALNSDVEGLADVQARFFEADGSEVELCGNGTACFGAWIADGGMQRLKILTPAGVVTAQRVDERYVRVCIPLPEGITRDIRVEALGAAFDCDFAVVGVPHLVVYVGDVQAVDVVALGQALRRHERFAPRGVNVNFVQVLGEGALAVRTFEFGVEGETLACGTGSAAAAILAATRFNWPKAILSGQQAVQVHVASRDVLRVRFILDAGGNVSDLCLDTVVRFACRGQLADDLLKQALGEAQR